jgi:hypothetical protein
MANRDEMIAYLLHEMPEPERALFAERWFAEPELYEELQMAEAELLDEYVRGKISEHRRRQIEDCLLASESQRQKWAFAVALAAALPTRKTWRLPWLGMVAAALVVSLSLSLWIGMRNRELRTELAQLRNPPPQVMVSGVYTIGLPSGTLRGSSAENEVQLPAGTRLLRVELELPPGATSSVYSAALLAGDHVVWNEGPIHPEGQGPSSIAVFWIPTDGAILGPGEHSVRLDAAGRASELYRFTIVR